MFPLVICAPSAVATGIQQSFSRCVIVLRSCCGLEPDVKNIYPLCHVLDGCFSNAELIDTHWSVE